MDWILQILHRGWRLVLNWFYSIISSRQDSSTETYRDSNGVYQVINGKINRWQKIKDWLLKFLTLLVLIIILCLVIKVVFSVILVALTIFVLLLIFFWLRRL